MATTCERKELSCFDTSCKSVSDEQLKSFFGDRYEWLDRNPECIKNVKTEEDALQILFSFYEFVPQDHPVWALFRNNPLLKTASMWTKYLHLHYKLYKKHLDLKDSMLLKIGQENEDLAIMRMRMYVKRCMEKGIKLPHVPSYEMGVFGVTFCVYGSNHEGLVVAIFLYNNPKFKAKEAGLKVMSSKDIIDYNMTDPVTKELITPDKIEQTIGYMGASADLCLSYVDETTGKTINTIAECKAKVPFFPGTGSKHVPFVLPGISFQSYENIKLPDTMIGYYFLQHQQQMLCCGVDFGFWMIYTPVFGMRVWKVKKCKELIELMVSLLMHICSEIKDNGGYDDPLKKLACTQNDYFECLDSCPAGYRRAHLRLRTLLYECTRMQNDIVQDFGIYTNHDTVLRSILQIGPSEPFVVKDCKNFPYWYPPEWSPCTLLLAYCHVFSISNIGMWVETNSDKDVIVGVQDPKDLHIRKHNIDIVLRKLSRFVGFTQSFIEHIINNENTGNAIYDQFISVRARKFHTAETLLNCVLYQYYHYCIENSNNKRQPVDIRDSCFRMTVVKDIESLFVEKFNEINPIIRTDINSGTFKSYTINNVTGKMVKRKLTYSEEDDDFGSFDLLMVVLKFLYDVINIQKMNHSLTLLLDSIYEINCDDTTSTSFAVLASAKYIFKMK
jgi:hypothetical protein